MKSTPMHARLDYLKEDYNSLFAHKAWRFIKEQCARSGRPLYLVTRKEVEQRMLVEMSEYNQRWEAYVASRRTHLENLLLRKPEPDIDGL